MQQVMFSSVLFGRLIIFLSIFLMETGFTSELEAESLGRLFTTPSQRASIDKFKANYIKGQKIDTVFFAEPAKKTVKKKVKKPVEKPVVFNGMVKRSSGRTAVWVNGVLVDSDQSKEERRKAKVFSDVSQDNSVVVKPVGTSRLVRLKPGQKWTPGSHIIIDPHQSITVNQKTSKKRKLKIIRHK